MDQAGERRTGFKDEHDGSGDRGGTQDQSNDRGRMWRHEQAVADEQDREPQGYDRNDGLCDYSIATLKLLERLQTDILGLAPSNDTQRWLQAQSLQTSAALLAARWQLSQNSANTPKQLLLLVMFWFTSYSPASACLRHATPSRSLPFFCARSEWAARSGS